MNIKFLTITLALTISFFTGSARQFIREYMEKFRGMYFSRGSVQTTYQPQINSTPTAQPKIDIILPETPEPKANINTGEAQANNVENGWYFKVILPETPSPKNTSESGITLVNKGWYFKDKLPETPSPEYYVNKEKNK